MRDGPEAGLALIDAIFARGDLSDYALAHSARADLCRRLDRRAEARSSYERALALTRLEPERRILQKHLIIIRKTIPFKKFLKKRAVSLDSRNPTLLPTPKFTATAKTKQT